MNLRSKEQDKGKEKRATREMETGTSMNSIGLITNNKFNALKDPENKNAQDINKQQRSRDVAGEKREE